jgi:hypothetical protein
MECGDYNIESLPDANVPDISFVRVTTSSGKRVYEAHGRYIPKTTPPLHQNLGLEFCGDLTGDGILEFVMLESSGGAHCCYTYYVVSLTTPPRRLLMWQKGDAATPLVPVKLHPGATWQLQGSVVIWPPFDPERGDPVLSYATAPVVPAVLSLVNGNYALTSLSFPEVYRKHRQELRADCADGNDCEPMETEIYAWIDALVIGDWDTERTQVTDLQLRAALDRHSAALRKTLARELGSRLAPGPLGPH